MNKEKISVLNKLFENGYNTEKEISEFTFDKLDEIDCIKDSEVSILIDLKKAIKEKKLIQFLSDEPKVKEK